MFDVLNVMLASPAVTFDPISVTFDVVYARTIRAARSALSLLFTAEMRTTPFLNVPIDVAAAFTDTSF